jgi:hypothetical protein
MIIKVGAFLPGRKRDKGIFKDLFSFAGYPKSLQKKKNV